MPLRHVIIGDIHGMRAELEKLLDRVKLTSDDKVVLLGDLMDRGPDSVGVVDMLCQLIDRGHDVTLLKGNHEEKHERFRRAFAHAGDKVKMRGADKLKAITVGLEPRHVEFLGSAVMFHRIPEHSVLCVHAGVLEWMQRLPGDDEWRSFTKPERDAWLQVLRVRRVRSRDQTVLSVEVQADQLLSPPLEASTLCDLGGLVRWVGAETPVIVKESKASKEGEYLPLHKQAPDDPFWADRYDGRFGHIYFGHEPFMDGVRHFPHATGIDTGAVFGGALTAVILETDRKPRFVSVSSRESYGRLYRDQ